MGRFFKNFPNMSQNWFKFKKILEKSGDFAQILAQNWANWYMNESLFLEELIFVWVYFHIPWWHIPTKTKLENVPLPPSEICRANVNHRKFALRSDSGSLTAPYVFEVFSTSIDLN